MGDLMTREDARRLAASMNRLAVALERRRRPVPHPFDLDLVVGDRTWVADLSRRLARFSGRLAPCTGDERRAQQVLAEWRVCGWATPARRLPRVPHNRRDYRIEAFAGQRPGDLSRLEGSLGGSAGDAQAPPEAVPGRLGATGRAGQCAVRSGAATARGEAGS